MRHIFILNPNAGNGAHLKNLREAIERLDCVHEIYETKERADATRYVRACCEKYTEPLRFYACGGDGTIKEVAEGVLGQPNASMSCCPIGSGNDFVKCFGGADSFSNVAALTNAEEINTDIIRIHAENHSDTYSVNVCNFGFEAYAAAAMDRVRRTPVLGGKNAYTTGILYALFRAMKNRGEIYADGKKLNENGAYLLCTVANGGYVGGGYRCAPRASVSDGYLEVCMVRPLSLFTFARLIKLYKAGEHLDDPKFAKYISYCRAEKIEVKSDTPFALCLDGEILETRHCIAEVLPSALRFAAPTVCAAVK